MTPVLTKGETGRSGAVHLTLLPPPLRNQERPPASSPQTSLQTLNIFIHSHHLHRTPFYQFTCKFTSPRQDAVYTSQLHLRTETALDLLNRNLLALSIPASSSRSFCPSTIASLSPQPAMRGYRLVYTAMLRDPEEIAAEEAAARKAKMKAEKAEAEQAAGKKAKAEEAAARKVRERHQAPALL